MGWVSIKKWDYLCMFLHVFSPLESTPILLMYYFILLLAALYSVVWIDHKFFNHFLFLGTYFTLKDFLFVSWVVILFQQITLGVCVQVLVDFFLLDSYEWYCLVKTCVFLIFMDFASLAFKSYLSIHISTCYIWKDTFSYIILSISFYCSFFFFMVIKWCFIISLIYISLNH